MKKITFQHHWAAILAIIALIAAGFPTARNASAQAPNAYVFLVREMELSELGVEGLEGLAYSPQDDVLLAIQSEQNGVRPVALVDRTEELLGVSQVQSQPLDTLNTAFNDETNSLFTVDPATQELTQTQLEPNGNLPTLATPAAGPAARFNLGFGIQRAQGMDFDPVSGRLFIVDPAGKRLWIVTPDAAGNYDGDRASRENRVKRVNLSRIADGRLHGLAYNPNSGNLFTLNETNDILYEVTENGELVSTRDISSFIELGSPAGMVFAPSGDMTDDPQTKSLYISDPSANSIAEFSITAVEVMALPPSSPVSLVNTIAANAWDPPAPDTAGIAYNPLTNRLVVSDSEVDEMPIYEGRNVFISSLNGNLQSTCDTTAFSKEPTGVAVNPANGSVFFSNDGKKLLHEVVVGPDGQYCTGDDQLRVSNMATYGARDPEGIGFGNGQLFIADGTNAEVWIIAPGPNGFFNGAPPSGDDIVVRRFDTASIGLRDPEGIDYHPGRGTIFIVSRGDDLLVETTLTGQVVRVFDLGFLNAVDPAGVGVGPRSNNPSAFSIYIAARGLDNNDHPKENDGKIYELNVDDGGGGPTATPTNTPQAGIPVNFTTIADAYINANNPTRNFGNVTTIRTDASPDIRSYLRFNVQGLTGPVVRATLRIFATNTTSAGYQVRGVNDNTWAENTINYTTAPALGNVIGSSGAVTINTWTTVDVTSYITGNGVFNLGLSTTNDNATILASREAANAPQLIVEIPVGSPPTSTPTATPTLPAATPTPTNTPPPGATALFLSLGSTGSGSLSFAMDEDILAFDGASFSQYFDGSDVGISAGNLDAFSIISSSSILMSFDQAITVPNIGQVDDFDIVQFNGTFGENTAGTFSLFFDGQDVGLDVSSEDIDVIHRLPDGTLLISTSGGISVPGASGLDEDILAFTPTSLGANTSGTWIMYFDGSDVGLSTDSGEDIDGLSIRNGKLYLTTRGAFAVTGVSGAASDIFSCTPTTLGANTVCTFDSSLFFTGSTWGLTANNVDGIELNVP